MRLSSVVLSFAALKAVLAATYTVELYVDSTDDSIAGKALSSIHEGAGINYFLLGTSAEQITYDDSTKYLGSDMFYVSTYDDFLLQGVLGAGNITFDGDHLVVNDVKDFYAAKNVNDPYQYSTQLYIVLTSNLDAPDSIKFNIKVSGLPSSIVSSAASETGSDTSSSLTSSVSASSTIETTEVSSTSSSSAVQSSTQSVEEQSTTSSSGDSESSTSGLALTSSASNSTSTTAVLTLSAGNSTTTSLRTSESSLFTSITTDASHSTHSSSSSSSATKTGSSSSKGAANSLNSVGAGIIAVACYLL